MDTIVPGECTGCSLKIMQHTTCTYEYIMCTKVSQEQTYENLGICNILDLQFTVCAWTGSLERSRVLSGVILDRKPYDCSKTDDC